MPVPSPPPQPPQPCEANTSAPVADARAQFARRTPQTAEEKARSRAFIDGKIEMVRGDPNLSEAQKAAAIAELEALR
ncbi:hypothetical protein [Janthinobacterium sp.]|uniref:hypothetical protein n=1 Tax=Janthinobacterium sp. TaxID=1871054 RepID=UPI00293D9D43|nr:hypothetical protein [Janthinobacterium sp.]